MNGDITLSRDEVRELYDWARQVKADIDETIPSEQLIREDVDRAALSEREQQFRTALFKLNGIVDVCETAIERDETCWIG